MAQLETSRETDGFDGTWGRSLWWFEAWGNGPKDEWTRRDEVGRPPRTDELRTSYYIVIGIQHANGEVIYRTRLGGIDIKPPTRKRKRKNG